MVIPIAPTNSHHGSSTLAPTSLPKWASAKVAGTATAMPETPTQNACATTIIRIRQRGMPSARSTAYSLIEATVAE